jgi:ankyrin repeat protein
MDKGSSPENPRWPSSPESPDAVSTPSAPLPDADAGFQDLVEHLIVKRPEQVNAKGGRETTPMHAAASGEHATTSKILRLLQEHRNKYGATPLHGASWSGNVSAGGCLLDLGAIINAQNDMTRTEPARER